MIAGEKPIDLYNLDLETLESLLAGWGTTRAHARLVWEYLYCHLVTHFDQMTALSPALRKRLSNETALAGTTRERARVATSSR